MMRRLSPVLVLLVALSPFRGAAAAMPTQPNILFILSDDQGMGDFSAYGNPVLKTPNLDRLREQCVRFTDFHSTPMCTPTRGELMTGQDAVRNGATSVTGGRSFMRPGNPTIAQFLAAAGYHTGIF
jgi:arylsulfatase